MNFGIICEFNPFHAGHKYLFDKARELGAKNIVCAMSGNAVQRGELAFVDKYCRAKGALQGGADLVLELPFPWSSASAEYFAMAGIKALAPYCDAIIFGSECGNIELLNKAAQKALSIEFCNEFEKRKKNGEGAAEAYFSLLEENLDFKLSSNDILAIEYIKAAKRCGLSLKFYTVQRMGSAYRDNNICEGEIPSASAIRNTLKNGDKSGFLELQPYTKDLVRAEMENGLITDVRLIEKALLLHFRLSDASELSCYAEADGGVAERICAAARENVEYDSFIQAIRTKRYTDAKLNRAILFCLTKVKRELLLKTPEYLYLLAANESGRKLLSAVKKNGNNSVFTIPIGTKPADAPRNCEQFWVEERLNAVFSLARNNAFSMGEAYKKNAFIIK